MRVDIELIERCRSNERLAQKQLYTQLLPYLVTVCSRYLNDRSYLNDVLQEAFIDLFKHLEKYDDKKSEFKTWAVRVAINRCFKSNRQIVKVHYMDENAMPEAISLEPGILARLEDEELMRFLKSMPIGYYTVFNLHVLDGFSHKEIADILEISEELSRKRLSRAREWLDERTDSAKRELNWGDEKRTII